jgi:acetyltransferase-like isoleucine patch superfamily enzyme
VSSNFQKIKNLIFRFVSRVVAKAGLRPLAYTLTPAGSIIAGYVAEARLGNADERVSIGKNSVLSCRIVLEREVGNVSIGDDTYIGSSTILCGKGISIGNNVLISWGCTICDHDSHSLNWLDRAEDVRQWREGLLQNGLGCASKMKNWKVVQMDSITICDKVWLGMNVTILKGVTIGEGSVVAAGSIVTKDVAPWTLVAGNPARFIRNLSSGD